MKRILLLIVLAISCSWNCISQEEKSVDMTGIKEYYERFPVTISTDYLCKYSVLDTSEVYYAKARYPKIYILLKKKILNVVVNGREDLYPIADYEFKDGIFKADLAIAEFYYDYKNALVYMFGKESKSISFFTFYTNILRPLQT